MTDESPADVVKSPENVLDAIPSKKTKTKDSPTDSGENGHPQGQWTTIPASPPRYVTFEQLMSAANGVKNMTLAHEIVVDNNFKIADPATAASGLEKQVRDVVHKAFWDHLQDQLAADPPVFTSSLGLLEELKSVLMSLTLPQHARLRTQIDDVFDMTLIKQQIDHGSLDVLKYSEYVINTLAKLCAPVRDENIEKLRNEKSIVPLFRGIFELMDLMKMDMANFTIHQIRPYLQQQSVEYEKTKFNEFLEKQKEVGIDGLALTRQWLQQANKRCLNKSPKSPVDASSKPTDSKSTTSLITPASVLNQAYLMLLDTDMNDDVDNFPETLLMDAGRFQDLHKKTWKLTIISAMLLVTYNTVGSPIAGINGLKNKLKSQAIIILENCHNKIDVLAKTLNVSDQIIKEINEVLTKHSFAALTDTQKQLLEAQIGEVIVEDHAVHKLIKERLLDFMTSMMSHDHKQPMKIPAGLSAVESDLSQVCGQFLRLVSHNRSVFSQHYGEIIDNIIQRDIQVVNGV